MSEHANDQMVDHHDDHGHHHKETFVTKYIFSQDHKMISKQYIITGLIMGFIGISMSLLFRLQLAWPDKQFTVYEIFLGKWAEDGVMDPNVYLALVTIHGTIMVFFLLTAGLSGTYPIGCSSCPVCSWSCPCSLKLALHLQVGPFIHH